MDFALTEEQQMLREAARGFLEKEPKARPSREPDEVDEPHSAALWQKMASQGWMGLAFPAQFGGADGNLVDLVILIEEMGRALLDGPFVPTVVYGGLPILHFGSEKQKQLLLPKLAAGDLIMTLALTGADRRFGTVEVTDRIEPDHEGYRISGTRLFVPDADVADYLLWAVQTKETDGLHLIDAQQTSGVTRSLLRTTALDRQFEVVLDNVWSVGLLGEPSRSREILAKIQEWGSLAQCAIMLGSVQRVLEMSVAYAQERVQFDRPIGSFQAIQHKLSDMAVDVETVRWLTYEAAWRCSQNLPAATTISMAKAWASEAAKRVCLSGVKIHGAVGIAMEHDMQRFFRRMRTTELAFGDAQWHWELVAQSVLGR